MVSFLIVVRSINRANPADMNIEYNLPRASGIPNISILMQQWSWWSWAMMRKCLATIPLHKCFVTIVFRSEFPGKIWKCKKYQRVSNKILQSRDPDLNLISILYSWPFIPADPDPDRKFLFFGSFLNLKGPFQWLVIFKTSIDPLKSLLTVRRKFNFFHTNDIVHLRSFLSFSRIT